MKRLPLLIVILVIAIVGIITLGSVFHESYESYESSKYNQSCKVEFTTESDLTLNTDKTDVNKHLTQLSEFIPASDGDYNGVVKYEWNQNVYGESDKIFNVYYDFDDYDIILDALLGTGTSGEIKEPIASAIKGTNDSTAFKVAVDIPTGINPDAGEAANKAINPDLIITFHDIKKGLENFKNKTVNLIDALGSFKGWKSGITVRL